MNITVLAIKWFSCHKIANTKIRFINSSTFILIKKLKLTLKKSKTVFYLKGSYLFMFKSALLVFIDNCFRVIIRCDYY